MQFRDGFLEWKPKLQNFKGESNVTLKTNKGVDQIFLSSPDCSFK